MDDSKHRCPLLQDPLKYNPDTIDLVNNPSERDYWLPCLENMVRNFVGRASFLNPDNPSASEKAEACFEEFHSLVREASKDPRILHPLSIRTLLEFNEDNLRKHNFKDAWSVLKEKETGAAFTEFKQRIDFIDSTEKFEERWLEIVKGVLAGNVFDWGSQAVADILETSSNFGLRHAMETMEKRPWFRDNVDEWIRRLKAQSYKETVIFVDNAGVDFVLGVLPMARELLKQGTKVILTANTAPALNDVTSRELESYVCRGAELCGVLREGVVEGRLVTLENGQRGPCLDLLNLPEELCKQMATADLVILEGMGRAVHTNLYAKLSVDCVKLAVIKNEWLAKSLGGRQFSVIFSYEPAT